MMAIGIRIVINLRSLPLKTRRRIVVTPTLSKHPIKVPNKVRTTTMLPTKPVAVFRILRCVVKAVFLVVVIPDRLVANCIPPLFLTPVASY